MNFDYETFLQTGGAFWHTPTTQNNGRYFGDKIEIDEIEVLECPADGTARVRELHTGDSFIVKSTESVKLGGQYKNYEAVVTKIYYEPKKWWQFWKKKKQTSFQVTWK